MELITAPEPFVNHYGELYSSIFLAGAIDMGTAVDWQKEAVFYFEPMRVAVYNPRRATPFTPDMLDEQIKWELDVMKKVDVVLMWFPADCKAPVAMLETGFLLPTGKLVLGAAPAFYRRRNLELTAEYYGVTVHPTLEGTLFAARERLVTGVIV